jgi:hypothetical protein
MPAMPTLILELFHYLLEAMRAKKLELLLTACLPISPERYLDIKNTKFVLP